MTERATEPLVLAMGQMAVEAGSPEENLDRAVGMIREAARRGAAVVVLPECLDLGWTDPSALEAASPIPGPRSERLAAAARDNGIHVVAGLTERDGDKRFNAAVLLSPTGEILLKHRKINLLDIEREFYSVGDRLGVADTPFGVVGVNICADNFAESADLGCASGRMGARLLLSPCAWAVDADHTDVEEPYRHWGAHFAALVRRSPMTVVGVSNVGWIRGGPWKGMKCIGCSLVVGPDAQPIARAPYGDDAETLELVSLDPRGFHSAAD